MKLLAGLLIGGITALALGAGAVTPWQQLAAYSIFANGGYRITPYIVRQIVEFHGGKVRAANRPDGSGVVFELRFPTI